jgi:hypothetical protein
MEAEETPMAITIRAHYDGKVIVPDEPVDLPISEPLEVELRPLVTKGLLVRDDVRVEEKRRLLTESSGRISAPAIPAEALRRENLYEERP